MRKIIAHKPSFRTEVNEQLKHQYPHNLYNQYYAAHSVQQTPDYTERFTCGPLVATTSWVKSALGLQQSKLLP